MTAWHLIWTGDYTKTTAIGKVLNGEEMVKRMVMELSKSLTAKRRGALLDDFFSLPSVVKKFYGGKWRILADFGAV